MDALWPNASRPWAASPSHCPATWRTNRRSHAHRAAASPRVPSWSASPPRTRILLDARPLARAAAEGGDDGSNDLIVSQVVRANELQSWFVVQHLAQHAEQA